MAAAVELAVSDIAFGAHKTLAYAENGADTGGRYDGCGEVA